MKNFKHAVPALLSVILVPLSSQAVAQAATLDDCQAIPDRLARYACYDNWDAASGTVRQTAPRQVPVPRQSEDAASEFGRASVRNDDASQADAPATAAEGGAQTTMSNFGRSESTARIVEGGAGSELIDTVADIEQLGPSLLLITLEGGQQWRQMISKRYNLSVGDDIRIYPTRWGSSYRLTAEHLGSYIQVQRVDAGRAALSTNTPAPRQTPPPNSAQRAEPEEERSLLGRLFDRDDGEEQPEEARVAPAGNSNTVEGFGRIEPDARILEGSGGKTELVDTVAELEQLGPSMLMITLSSGQKWKQMISKRYNLNVGDEIRIYPTRWGSSYRLTSERAGSYIQVERVD